MIAQNYFSNLIVELKEKIIAQRMFKFHKLENGKINKCAFYGQIIKINIIIVFIGYIPLSYQQQSIPFHLKSY